MNTAIRSTLMLSVLLVDPSADERGMYADYLGHQGMAPIQSTTTAGALKAARSRSPDAIVVETHWRQGRNDGLALIRSLRSDTRTKHIPIIVVSGHAFDSDRVAALEAGCDVFCAKPCPLTRLAAELERVVRVPEGREGG
jgi:DNA-binding response OmpR family regulator